ncbi:hypothetical protein KDX27_39355 [Burkholderia cenocepacia]|uniref:hypothetical protein n=1 Tax=Burkholderia cepacia complex TaxID=87882 RepID=UPI001B8DF177|nr:MULTISPECIES: hypothetical protein [Burkholderia cepacia complex]MBR8173750.1 hypothetical protein [Burkholderia cenocepacia]MCO8318999.1 hypothetical protein [Burkholderia multivorans]
MNIKSNRAPSELEAYKPLRSFREPRAMEWHKLVASEQGSLSEEKTGQVKDGA